MPYVENIRAMVANNILRHSQNIAKLGNDLINNPSNNNLAPRDSSTTTTYSNNAAGIGAGLIALVVILTFLIPGLIALCVWQCYKQKRDAQRRYYQNSQLVTVSVPVSQAYAFQQQPTGPLQSISNAIDGTTYYPPVQTVYVQQGQPGVVQVADPNQQIYYQQQTQVQVQPPQVPLATAQPNVSDVKAPLPPPS
ncbi:hypothetical protein HDU76_005667 [Blyttiomyces sp. JEL0837]|nr:hypothetical protein HDU76_005667 [Blyttiomyces sp. JEL0837]